MQPGSRAASGHAKLRCLMHHLLFMFSSTSCSDWLAKCVLCALCPYNEKLSCLIFHSNHRWFVLFRTVLSSSFISSSTTCNEELIKHIKAVDTELRTFLTRESLVALNERACNEWYSFFVSTTNRTFFSIEQKKTTTVFPTCAYLPFFLTLKAFSSSDCREKGQSEFWSSCLWSQTKPASSMLARLANAPRVTSWCTANCPSIAFSFYRKHATNLGTFSFHKQRLLEK